MNPTLLAGIDFTAPEGTAWLITLVGFLAAGCGAVCGVGLSCLAHEVWRSLQSHQSRPTTLQAEFMGFGVAKERYRPAAAPAAARVPAAEFAEVHPQQAV